MTKKKIMCIVNPNADMGNAWKHTIPLHEIGKKYAEIEWVGTTYPKHATSIAKTAAEEGFDIVVAVGGDGTAHEVINGLMEVKQSKCPKFGIVPLGSGNDYAANLGLPLDSVKALEAILTGEPKSFDVGVVEDEQGRKEYWNNTVNIGFGGLVTIFSHSVPFLRGFLMYLVAVIRVILFKYQILDVKVNADGFEWNGKTLMISVNNGPREGGGFITAPNAKMNDGIFNYAIMDKVSRLMMLRLIPEFMNGTQEKFKQVHPGIFKKLTINSKQPLYLHLDGEVFAGFANDVHQLKFDIIENGIDVLVPAK
jgi:diacylglycerol kinase (ATP)